MTFVFTKKKQRQRFLRKSSYFRSQNKQKKATRQPRFLKERKDEKD